MTGISTMSPGLSMKCDGTNSSSNRRFPLAGLMEVTVAGTVPTFVTNTLTVFVLPTGTEPKATLVVLMLSVGWTPLPETGTSITVFDSSSLTMPMMPTSLETFVGEYATPTSMNPLGPSAIGFVGDTAGAISANSALPENVISRIKQPANPTSLTFVFSTSVCPAATSPKSRLAGLAMMSQLATGMTPSPDSATVFVMGGLSLTTNNAPLVVPLSVGMNTMSTFVDEPAAISKLLVAGKITVKVALVTGR